MVVFLLAVLLVIAWWELGCAIDRAMARRRRAKRLRELTRMSEDLPGGYS